MVEPVSVLILTLNEELLIGRAIRSAAWANEVVVLDSGSTDRTREIAESLGAHVYTQPWLGWTLQHRKAAELARNDWVMPIDADEVITPELAKSIVAAMSSRPDPNDGYVVDRRDEFLGELMFNLRRRSKRANFVRLFDRRKSRYDETMLIHEEVVVPGRAIPLPGFLLHWRNSLLSHIVATFNRNADLEVKGIVQSSKPVTFVSVAIKPMLRFGWVYFVCGHWRFGTRGFILAGMHAFSEFLRQARAWEQLHSPPRPHPPRALSGFDFP
jgi:glycosyltransferase involved in cell wall biosynthesis